MFSRKSWHWENSQFFLNSVDLFVPQFKAEIYDTNIANLHNETKLRSMGKMVKYEMLCHSEIYITLNLKMYNILANISQWQR